MISLCDTVFQRLSDLQALDITMSSAANQMKQSLLRYQSLSPEDSLHNLIQSSLNNILINPAIFETQEQSYLFQKSCLDVFNAIYIFSKSMTSQADEACKAIERKLFEISFIPNDSYETKILPIYHLHDQFLTITAPSINFKKHKKSGKMKCIPFFLTIRAIQEKMAHPFIIITQPSFSIINDQIRNLTDFLGDSVLFVTDENELEKMYQTPPSKPVIALFTSFTLIKVINRSDELKYNLVKYARFVLNDLHIRSLDNDVLVSLLSEKVKKCSFPLQLLLNSAETDIRVHNSFGRVETFEVSNQQPFKIDEVAKEALNSEEFDGTVRDSVSDIIQSIVNDSYPQGNIMVVTSQPKRIQNIASLISEEVEKKLGSLKTRVRLLKNMENYLVSATLFYEHLEEIFCKDDYYDRTIYILVIKNDKKRRSKDFYQICSNPIRNHPNIIKIVVTNSESPLVVDNLAALVDCGICDQQIIDKKFGLIKIEEGPISFQTQFERRSLVGRNRPGIYSLVTLADKQLVGDSQTSIETDDLTSGILALRKIGTNFEDIQNLPAPGISPEILDQYMKKLTSLGAIDNDKKLTSTGSHFAPFLLFTPFLSSAIVKTSLHYKDDSKIASVVGVFVYFIFETGDLFDDPTNEAFRKNFHEQSDVITLFNTLLEAISVKSHIKQTLKSFGFNVKNALKLIENVEEVAYITYDENKKSLWEEISKFSHSIDMMDFIQRILISIEQVMPDWITYRIVEYTTIIDVSHDYSFIYKGQQTPLIKMKMRPGAKGFASPGFSYILQLKSASEDEYVGSIIHRDLSTDEIPHPMIIEAPSLLNNVFTPHLIESYIDEHLDRFIPFQESTTYNESSNDGLSCYPQQFGDSAILSFVPYELTDKEAITIINEAASKIAKIIPYVPRTILVKDDSLKAIAAITSSGLDNFTTKVIFYTDLKPSAYQVDKTTIDYMADNINELSSIDGNLGIAMTGERFVKNVEGQPTTRSDITSVFGANSHLVVLSEKKIQNCNRMPWVEPSFDVVYSPYDHCVQISNNIFKDVVVVDHDYDQLYVMLNNAKIQVKGAVFGRIYQVFNQYSANFIKDGILTKSIDFIRINITGNFKTGGLKDDIIAFNQVKKNHPDLDMAQFRQQIPKGIKDLLVERGKIDSEYKSILHRLESNARDKKELRKTKTKLSNSIKKIDKDINDLAQPLLQQFHLTKDEFFKLLNIQSPSNLLEIESLFVYPSHMEGAIEVPSLSRVTNSLNQYRRGLIIDHVPLCTITINHLINCSLKSGEFKDIIYKVCDRFGGIVYDVQDYLRVDNDPLFCGLIQVTIFTCEFAQPFVVEVARAIGPYGGIPVSIPSCVIPPAVVARPEAAMSIAVWIKKNGLQLTSYRNKLAGGQGELERAKKLLAAADSQPKVPFKTYDIPVGADVARLVDAISEMNRNFDQNLSCIVDIPSRVMLAPAGFDEERIQAFINEMCPSVENKDDIPYDYFLSCRGEKASLSEKELPLYHDDGTFSKTNFCVTCARELFRAVVRRFLDEDKEGCKVDMKLVKSNLTPTREIRLFNEHGLGEGLSIPFGQFCWYLVEEPLMSDVMRARVCVLVNQTFRASQRLECCPVHPSTVYRVNSGQQIRCTRVGCQLFLCAQCRRWHKSGECKIVRTPGQGQRCCPSCRRIVVKCDSCNNIACKCGKFFCFFCGFGPEGSREAVFAHIEKEHKDAFDDPPDYRKFVLGENVADDEIEDFYQKFPALKPPTKRKSGVSAVLSLLKKA